MKKLITGLALLSTFSVAAQDISMEQARVMYAVKGIKKLSRDYRKRLSEQVSLVNDVSFFSAKSKRKVCHQAGKIAATKKLLHEKIKDFTPEAPPYAMTKAQSSFLKLANQVITDGKGFISIESGYGQYYCLGQTSSLGEDQYMEDLIKRLSNSEDALNELEVISLDQDLYKEMKLDF